jgi:prepilin signal peptidase PulO-like enzyme (type II secretory pathway)
VWLGGLLSLYLGWLGGQAVVTGTVAGWLLALVGLGYRRVVRRSDDNTDEIPLGPYLCLGALVAILSHGR